MPELRGIELPGLSHDGSLLALVAVGILGLVLLVARFKVHAFLALTLASIFVGLASGMDPIAITKAFQEGVGLTLGLIAVVVGLGTMLGRMLAESGGAATVAATFIGLLGRQRLHWTMMLVAFLVGLPVFFPVGLVLLMPILLTLVRETRLPFLFLGIPMVAGLSISHTLVPPHPGPMVAIEKLQADVGKTIFWAVLFGLPVAALAGPLFGRLVAARIEAAPGGLSERLVASVPPRVAPGFGLTLLTILLPVLLMMLATIAQLALPETNFIRSYALFLGSPLVALLIAVLFSFYSFGARCGYGRGTLLKFMEDCLGPTAGIMLVVGAGGGFSKVLEHCGAAKAIAAVTHGWSLSPLLLGWVIAALIRIAVGSATVAITLSAGIMAPIAAVRPGTSPELLVLALGAGSLVLSHFNDGGFWFVKEYFNLTVIQTLKTWTVMVTIASLATLALVLLADRILH